MCKFATQQVLTRTHHKKIQLIVHHANNSPTYWLGTLVYKSFGVYSFYSYGDVLPVVEREMAVIVATMVTGLFFLGYIVASLAADLANADTRIATFRYRIKAIRNYMEVVHAY